ncbi:MAG: hypothetical protein Q7J29_14725 [Stagnimonas sp.]|jgi:hypothetical protein|nr:hypothetical protein [Stagnimonas sp.]
MNRLPINARTASKPAPAGRAMLCAIGCDWQSPISYSIEVLHSGVSKLAQQTAAFENSLYPGGTG